MRLICPHCTKPLNLADEKVPAGQRFKLVCPQCNEPFVVDPQKLHDKPAGQPALELQPQSADTEFYPPGAKVAFLFVLDPDWAASLLSCLKERGYYLAVATDQPEALRKIDAASYHLIFIDHSPQAAEVMQRIHAWNGIQRRFSNVVLIGQEARSLHPHASFQHGVNWYFHQDDFQHAPRLVQMAIDGYDEYYSVWRLAAKALSKLPA